MNDVNMQGIPSDAMNRAARLKRARSRRVWKEKDDLIAQYCKDKIVLDLGFVGHSLDRVVDLGDDWLHRKIKKNAKSVLGVDILMHECEILSTWGYDTVCADVMSMDLGREFDVVVCGDIIEHVSNVGCFLDVVRKHLAPEGIAIITTPNPFNIEQFVHILINGSVKVNGQHVLWLDPKTACEVCSRHGLLVIDHHWIKTRFNCLPSMIGRRTVACIVRLVQYLRPYFMTDFMVVCTRT